MKGLMILAMFVVIVITVPASAFFGEDAIEKVIKDFETSSYKGPPHIDSIEPSVGAPCILVTIKGKNFKGIGSVKFGWKTARIIEQSDNKLVVEVPYGKGGEETVEVTVGVFDTSNSVPFTYKNPIIDSIFLSSGKVGTEVAIKGKYFGVKGSRLRFYVKFGRSHVYIDSKSWTDTEIIAKAPSDYGTGINDAKMMLNLVTYAYYGWAKLVDKAIEKAVMDTLIYLATQGVRIPGGEGKIEVDVRVTTPVGKSNARVFTYQLSDETLPTLPLPEWKEIPLEKTEHPWPMVRHDSQHTGRSPYPGPERPSLKWKIRSSNCRWVAIAKEGTIYGEFSSEFGGGTQLCAINSDGRLKWKSEVGYAPLGIVDTGVIYVSGDWKSGDSSVSGRAELWGISPKGTIQLEKEIIDAPPIPEDVTKRIATKSLIVGNDGMIYFVLGNRKSAILYSFSQNGSLNWKFLFVPAGFGHPLPAICKDGIIYLISKEKGSYFLNAITPNGKLKWRYEISVDNLIDWKIEKETANLKGKGVPYSARYRQQRRTFLREHGFPTLVHYDFPQLVIGDDGTIYFVVVGDFLCAISPEGFLRWKKWRINEGNFSGCSLPAISVDGTIYISAYISSATLASSNNSLRHKVIAFGSNGQLRWSSVPLRELRTPLTVDSNGTVYFVDNQGIVHALNRDGTLKWRFPTDQPANAYLSGGTIAIGKNGVLYFLGGFTNYPQQQYGYLYAIGEVE